MELKIEIEIEVVMVAKIMVVTVVVDEDQRIVWYGFVPFRFMARQVQIRDLLVRKCFE